MGILRLEFKKFSLIAVLAICWQHIAYSSQSLPTLENLRSITIDEYNNRYVDDSGYGRLDPGRFENPEGAKSIQVRIVRLRSDANLERVHKIFPDCALERSCKTGRDHFRAEYTYLEKAQGLTVGGRRIAPELFAAFEVTSSVGNLLVIDMEYISGFNLNQYIYDSESTGFHDIHGRLSIALKIFRIVDALKDAGIFHGDLADRNIMVDRDNVVLLDYEMARDWNDQKFGGFSGKFASFPPEYFSETGLRPSHESSVSWSLGLLLYELVADDDPSWIMFPLGDETPSPRRATKIFLSKTEDRGSLPFDTKLICPENGQHDQPFKNLFQEICSLIAAMTSFKPRDRIKLPEAIERLEGLVNTALQPANTSCNF